MTNETSTPAPETPAAPETTTPEQAAQQEQENEAAFADGFAESRGETPETPSPEARSDKSPDAPEAEKKPEPTPDKPATLIAGKTEAEVMELFSKVPNLEQMVATEVSKIYGKFGELQRTLNNIKPGQSTLKIKGALKRLSQEFPEVAQMLSEDLADYFELAPDAPAATAAPEAASPNVDARIQQAVNTAVEQVREQTERKLLTVLHSDWETLSKEKEFDTFLKSLPGKPTPVKMPDGRTITFPEEAAKYIESQDALTTAACFTQYKSWKSKNQKSTKQNQNRLEDAITPSSNGAPPPPASLDDESAFLDGYKTVRQGAS